METREQREAELRELFKKAGWIGPPFDEVITDLADDWELRRRDAEEYSV